MAVIVTPSATSTIEFTPTSKTVSINNTADDQYKITEVTYRHQNDVIFNDLTLSVSTNHFTYSSKFENSVDRVVYFTLYDDQTHEVIKRSVKSPNLLPEQYATVYKMDPPASEAIVTFTIQGETRHRIEISDPESPTPSYQWSQWGPFTATHTLTIQTNNESSIRQLEAAVNNGSFAKQSERI